MEQHAEPTKTSRVMIIQPEDGCQAEQQKGPLGNQSVETTGARPGDTNEPKNAQPQIIDSSTLQSQSTSQIGGSRLRTPFVQQIFITE